jgi:hypothetical protein
MNLAERLRTGYSKVGAASNATWLKHNPQELRGWLQALDDPKLGKSAAWALGQLALKGPQVAQSQVDHLVRLALENRPEYVHRNVFHVLTHLEIPEESMAALFDRCCEITASPAFAVAVRVHAMQVAAELCGRFPELGPELRQVIALGYEEASAGYHSRARKILATL